MQEAIDKAIQGLRQEFQAKLDDNTRQSDDALRTHSHGLNGVYSIHLDDIVGMFGTISAAPTDVPTDAWSQIRVYKNGTTYRLYWYDQDNHAWRYATGT